ncbi:hypothetical protein MNBD_PLANCTO02-357, partial [hydrothermal vent metagenome]
MNKTASEAAGNLQTMGKVKRLA